MFGFTYEDSECEKYAINKYLKNKPKINGIMILSGGETMFDIVSIFDNGNLTAVDINQEQINIVKEKISIMNDKLLYKKYLENLFTPFDELFIQIKNGSQFTDIFSRENLVNKFGPNAVLNTSKDFAFHFEEIYKIKQNEQDIFYKWIFERNMEYFVSKNKINSIESIKKVNIVCDNIINLLYSDFYDFIQVSNLGDWMNYNEFIEFCSKIKKSLKLGGICVIRRLLSDNLLIDQFEGCEVIIDKTYFYKETIIWQNN